MRRKVSTKLKGHNESLVYNKTRVEFLSVGICNSSSPTVLLQVEVRTNSFLRVVPHVLFHLPLFLVISEVPVTFHVHKLMCPTTTDYESQMIQSSPLNVKKFMVSITSVNDDSVWYIN